MERLPKSLRPLLEAMKARRPRLGMVVAGGAVALGLHRIPLEHQTLLELYYWESMTAPDIAEILDVPVGTIRTRIRRAKSLVEAAMQSIAADVRLFESTVTDLETWARSVRALTP